MGNGGSKPEQHVFNADTPVRFSQSVVDSLQKSPETDSTRAQDTELKIQSRVNSELKRIRDSQAKQLSYLTATLTTNAPKEDATSQSSSKTKSEAERSHDSVQKEIMDLRKKLDSRKKLEKVSPEVEKAKEHLVSCLRTNDRRPLDCWQEVETFKAEVAKLEKAFIQQASR